LQDASQRAGQHGSLTRQTVKGIVWITFGRVLKAPINLIAMAVLARLLTPTDFGVFALGMIVVSFTNMMVDGSFGMVLIQRHEIDPPMIGASLALSAALASLAAIVIVASAP